MNGRILAERLLATTSVAVLALVMAAPEAQAAACTAVNGGVYVNNAALDCIAVTGNSVSITNSASGVVGPAPSAIAVNPGVTVSGGIINAGRIVGAPTSATALGIAVQGLVQGGITNSGTISVNALIGGATTAAAVGIVVFGTTGPHSAASSFGGTILNTGTITATASSSGVATGLGIAIRASTFSGDIVNSSTIAALASGTLAAVTGIAASALSFSGSISNNGTISVAANSAGGFEGVASGIAVYGSTASLIVGPSGFFSSVASSFGGSIISSGTIAATASSGFITGAAGLYADSSTFSGGITNGGSITATAESSLFAGAVGIDLGAVSVGGGIANDAGAAISATASAAGSLGANAIGIIVHGTTGNFSVASSFAGSVVNLGSVAAVATNSAGAAAATGISLTVSTFDGSVINNGSVSAIASGRSALGVGLALFAGSYLGGINNSGSILASATVTAGGGLATATGILICDCAGPFSGGIVNSGTILATAQGRNTARAVGTSLNATTFLGGLSNNGAISAAANARNFAAAAGIGIGLETPVSVFSGGIANSGAVSASATATSSGFAQATGIAVFAASLGGNISNSAGTIAAAAQVANGTATAIGLKVQTDTVFAGNIVNSGTISAAATRSGGLSGSGFAAGIRVDGQGMSGTISNSGTVTAAANKGTALGILVSTFTGTIANSGTIAATAPGTGTGVGIGLAASAATIVNTGTIAASTWAINLAHANGANTIDQNAGSIIGPLSGAGGAILFSTDGDTLNINGGTIAGNIAGSGGVGATVNVQPGAGQTFSYAGTMSGIGSTNLKSGTLLLQTTAGISTTSYNQSAGTTLALAVTPALDHPSINASGTVLVTSGAVLEAVEGAFAWTPGTYNYGAVVTGGTINGSFTATSNSPFFVASLAQSGTADNLTLTMLSPGEVPGLNSTQQSVANAIIGIPGGDATLDQLFLLSDPGPALTQLSGVQFTSTNYQSLITIWQAFSSSLSDRLLQGGAYGGMANASYDSSHGIQFAQADVPQVAQASDGGHGGPSSVPHRWGFWARGYGLSSDASSTATSAAYSESGAGLIVGADNQITDRIVAGIALNISTDKANVSGGGFTQTNAYQGSAYGQYAIDPNWYVNGIAGFGWQTYKTQRVVSFFGTNVNNGSFDGQSYQLYGETGYALHPAFLPRTRVTPYLGLSYLHVHTDGFTETGSTTALSVQAMDPNSFTTTLGARAAATLQIGTTVFRPELRAGWQHEFLDTAATMRAAFATAPGSVFTATGTSFGRESFLGGAGVTTTITSSTQIFFDYDAKVNGGYTAQAVSGGLRVQF